MPAARKPCGQPLAQTDVATALCTYPRAHGKTMCVWHWLLKRPIEQQVQEAQKRLKSPHFTAKRMRVPASEWPAGERWCSGCQTFVPLFYTLGSRCRACGSQANHASHIRRTYDLTEAEYQELLNWQGGRCFVCGQIPRGNRRLAVDHDHRTGEVRGLLCANDEWGCNRTLARILNDLDAAQRVVEYLQRYPLQRMRDGEPARRPPVRPSIADSLRDWTPPSNNRVDLGLADGHGFVGGRLQPGVPYRQGASPEPVEPWRPFG